MSELKPVKIKIVNFQSIEDLEFEVYGFTCITGKSNIGKSAIIRAVSSALMNNSVGGLVRKEASFCSIDVQTDGMDLKWSKGEKVPGKYVLNGKEYEKVGQKQLPKIEELGFGSVRVGKRDIRPWHASQFKPIFLLDDSGPAITEFISEVSRLNVLQDSIILSLRRRKHAIDKIKAKTEDIKKHDEKLAKLKDLDSLIELKEELEEQAKSIRKYEEKVLLGESIKNKLDSIANSIRLISDIADVEISETDEISELFNGLESAYKCWHKMELAARRVLDIREKGDLEVPDSSDLFEYMNNLSAAILYHEKIEKAKESVNVLSNDVKIPPNNVDPQTLDAMITVNGKIQEDKERIKELESESDELNLEIQFLDIQLEGIPKCPSCDRPIVSDHVHG